jgi:hypothetical protein
MQPVTNLRIGRYWSAEQRHQHTQRNVCRNLRKFQTHAKRAPDYCTQPFYFTFPYPMQGSGVVPDPRVMCTYRSFPLEPVVNHDYHSLSYRQRDWRRKPTFGLAAKPNADNGFWSPLLRILRLCFSYLPKGEEWFPECFDRKVQITTTAQLPSFLLESSSDFFQSAQTLASL